MEKELAHADAIRESLDLLANEVKSTKAYQALNELRALLDHAEKIVTTDYSERDEALSELESFLL